VSLRDELRPEAGKTLADFSEAGIQLKIISGDHPQTVTALARQAGIGSKIKVASGEELTGLDAAELAQVTEETTVFGRITPQQKAQLVQALRNRGHYVAMIGDGVNDVLALKQANLGIAMQSGSSASRGVADIVLLQNSFASLPQVFQEGQRIRNGMRAILQLFLTRIAYATILVLATMVIDGFPFAPKQNALLTFLTEGVPTVALAAWARPGLLRRHDLLHSLLHFVLPAALTISLAGLGVYMVALITTIQAAYPGASELDITPGAVATRKVRSRPLRL
jgi:cation-transporting ATPase E